MDFSRLDRYSRNWDGPAGVRPKAASGLARWLRSRLPIRSRDQQVFALVLAQSLTEGLDIDRGLTLAADVASSRRFWQILEEMRWQFRSGLPLDESLRRTGAWVDPALPVALRVGMEQGNLTEELSAYGRRGRLRDPAAFAHAVGRSPEAMRFAEALARLLSDRRLTVPLIRDAGRLASARSRRFARVVEQIAMKMEDGDSLVDCLRRQPADFDPLYCAFLDTAESREALRACLGRLGGADG